MLICFDDFFKFFTIFEPKHKILNNFSIILRKRCKKLIFFDHFFSFFCNFKTVNSHFERYFYYFTVRTLKNWLKINYSFDEFIFFYLSCFNVSSEDYNYSRFYPQVFWPFTQMFIFETHHNSPGKLKFGICQVLKRVSKQF